MEINKLIISKEEANKHFSNALIGLYLDTPKPICNFFGVDVLVSSEDLGDCGIAFKYPIQDQLLLNYRDLDQRVEKLEEKQ